MPPNLIALYHFTTLPLRAVWLGAGRGEMRGLPALRRQDILGLTLKKEEIS